MQTDILQETHQKLYKEQNRRGLDASVKLASSEKPSNRGESLLNNCPTTNQIYKKVNHIINSAILARKIINRIIARILLFRISIF